MLNQQNGEMPLSLNDLIGQPDLGLVELLHGATSDCAISWASSSDLADPTPFLVADQLLLTTGRHFLDDAGPESVRAYVSRLVQRDVVGIGFGTEVLRDVPTNLVDACREARMPLVEVPYGTPFLAIIRRIAHDLERAARARDDWALAASRAISAAALPRGEVAAVLRELANRLGARVMLFDADGQLERAFPPARAAIAPELRDEVHRLLANGARAAIEHVEGEQVTTIQTIGPAEKLAGALAVAGPRPDRAARTVITAAVALVEVEIAAGRRNMHAELARNAVVLELLRDGRTDSAHRIAAAAEVALPREPLTVVVTGSPNPALTTLAERVLSAGRLTLLDRGRLINVVSASSAAALIKRLVARGDAVGSASARTWQELDAATLRADIARRRAQTGSPLAWEQIELDEAGIDDEAIAGVLVAAASEPVGAAEIAAAEAWFDANCAWGPAATALSVHPHTLRGRVRALAARVGLSVDDFEGRVRLWSALRNRRLAT